MTPEEIQTGQLLCCLGQHVRIRELVFDKNSDKARPFCLELGEPNSKLSHFKSGLAPCSCKADEIRSQGPFCNIVNKYCNIEPHFSYCKKKKCTSGGVRFSPVINAIMHYLPEVPGLKRPYSRSFEGLPDDIHTRTAVIMQLRDFLRTSR